MIFCIEGTMYRKVANSSLSRLVARFQISRRLMKGKFDAYVLRNLAKIFRNLNYESTPDIYTLGLKLH